MSAEGKRPCRRPRRRERAPWAPVPRPVPRPSPSRKRLLFAALAVAVLVGALAAAWKFTDLAEVVTADRVMGWLDSISGRWWAPVALVLAYTPAALVMFPRPLLTLAAVAVFGPLLGFAYAMAGVLLSAVVGWLAGRNIDERRIRRWAGPRLDRIKRVLRKEGLLAMAAVGLLPVAPFTIEMLVAGALRVKLHHVLGGVFIAMLPGMVGTTVLGHQFLATLHGDREMNRWVVGATIAVLAAIGFATQRWWKRVQAEVEGKA